MTTKKKVFRTFNGQDFTYPELYASLFGTDVPLQDFALDQLRIVEEYLASLICRSEYCRYFQSVELKSGQKFTPNCRSWRCEKCRLVWGRKWSSVIAEQLEYTPATMLLNLTTSEMIDFQVLENALRRFIKAYRAWFGPTQYIKVVEYNKKHTQPHFHLILCCSEYTPPPMPKDWDRKLSWPQSDFEFAKYFWEEALAYYNPEAKPTTVVWTQPVDNGPAATRYAIGYITGQQNGKNEEPDSTWKGRKLTYSRGFFSTPTAKIWARLLERWFPDRPKDPIFGLLINPDECEQSGIPAHLLTKQVKRKLALTSYWLDNGSGPVEPEPGIIFHDEEVQGSFEVIEPPEKLPFQKNFNIGRTDKAIREMIYEGQVCNLPLVTHLWEPVQCFIRSKNTLTPDPDHE